jgi:hypothetical protein
MGGAPKTAGRVEITSTVTGLQGFWIGGDFATYTDGAGTATEANNLVFPLVSGQTEINLTNLDHASSISTFHLVEKSGKDVGPVITRSLVPYAAYQSRVSDLFGNVDISEAMYVRVVATTLVAGTEVVRGFLVKTESAVLNAVNGAGVNNVLNFVHAVSGSMGSGNYTTVVGVINLSSVTQTVKISFNSDLD